MKRLSLGVAMGGLTAVTVLFAACGTNEPVNGAGAGGGPGLVEGGAGGRTASGGRNGAGGGSGVSSQLGADCLVDVDCGEGLTCLAEDSDAFGGGVPGGVCTVDCLAGEGATCRRFSDASICVQFDDTTAYCLEACELGEPTTSLRKCHGRSDMACSPLETPGVGVCFPTCRGDFECGGRLCDLSTGLCVDSLTGTIPFGGACDPDAEVDQCRGSACVSVASRGDGGPPVAFCTGICRLGSDGCGEDPEVPTLDALCLLVRDQSTDTGDLALCAQLCDCNDDCGNPEMVCQALPSDYQERSARTGRCSAPFDSSGDPVSGIACSAGPPDSGPPPQPDAGTGGTGGLPEASPD